MPRQRNIAEYEEMMEVIKDVARAQMAQEGTDGLSLRAIARQLDVTAPALYRYYPSRDDLITALLADGFNNIATALANADASVEPTDFRGRATAIYRAYREWALTNRVDFQLIYGNPIPGYVAPAEITVPLVIRGFRIIGTMLVDAWRAGQITLDDPAAIPASTLHNLERIAEQESAPGPVVLLYKIFTAWPRIHGLVVLEMHGHLHETVGDESDFFEHELSRLIDDLGFL